MAITITKPTVGGSNNTWGQLINDSLDTVTNAVNGTAGTLSPDLELGAWKIGGSTITITGAELNLLDGNTTAIATVVEGTDTLVYNDNGVMKQVSLSDIATFMQASGHAATSSQPSVDNSGSTYIQDITLDANGHVTGITSTDVSSSLGGGFVAQGSWSKSASSTYQFTTVSTGYANASFIALLTSNFNRVTAAQHIGTTNGSGQFSVGVASIGNTYSFSGRWGVIA